MGSPSPARPDVVAFIPARGGSKSIPRKNIQLIGGRPLVLWVAEACARSRFVARTVVATEDEEIRRCVERAGVTGVEVVGRSARSASDTASTESAMLEFARASDREHIALAQATSPLLSTEDVDGAVEAYLQSGVDSLLTVVRTKRFLWTLDGDGLARPVNYDPSNRPRRQEWAGQLVENGALYITSTDRLLETGCRVSGRVGTYEMPQETYYELDEPADWAIVERLLARRRARAIRQSVTGLKLLCLDVDGTLTDGAMYYGPDGEALKRFDTRDGMGLGRLSRNGIDLALCTGENSPIVAARAKKLGIEEVHLGIDDKVGCIAELLDRLGYEWASLAFIGDDLNDLEVLQRAGFSACPADASPRVRDVVDYVCQAPGGHGAVREVCELLLEARS